MLRVGLTGGIACGKSVVRALLAARGAYTVDADAIVHALLGPGTETSQEVARAFGPHVLLPSGAVDRKKLGAIVFADPEARARLNGIVHPKVLAEEERLLAEAQTRGERIAVVDAALMIETGSYRRYDRVVVVYCSREAQIARLTARTGLSEEDAERRVDSQIPAEAKKQYADYVIDTSGSIEDTKHQVDALWEKLQSQAE